MPPRPSPSPPGDPPLRPPPPDRWVARPLLLALICGSIVGCSGGSSAPTDAASTGPSATVQEETRPLGKPATAKKP